MTIYVGPSSVPTAVSLNCISSASHVMNIAPTCPYLEMPWRLYPRIVFSNTTRASSRVSLSADLDCWSWEGCNRGPSVESLDTLAGKGAEGVIAICKREEKMKASAPYLVILEEDVVFILGSEWPKNRGMEGPSRLRAVCSGLEKKADRNV